MFSLAHGHINNKTDSLISIFPCCSFKTSLHIVIINSKVNFREKVYVFDNFT